MSDSGKVSLPTPERIEEIKRMAKFQHPLSVGIVTNGEFLELLAALEESQQQLTLERDRTNYWGEREGTAKLDLIEAQQTIADMEKSLKWKDDGCEFWISMAGRLADACEIYTKEWDEGVAAEDALSYYLPAVGRRNKEVQS